MSCRKALTLRGVLICVALLFAPYGAAQPATPDPEVRALIERAHIENMLADYYALFAGRSQGDFGAYYTDDGILDANGAIAQGRVKINALYRGIWDEGNTQVLISNPRITVKGDTATVDLVWTEVVSKKLLAAPQIVEQGHEHDDLVKHGDRWLFVKRLVTNDGGLPAALEKTYKKR